MSGLNKSNEKDWTRLLTDPELVGHIGKLLQAYREAAPEMREEALLAAMRKIRQNAASAAASSTTTTPAESSAAVAAPIAAAIPSPTIEELAKTTATPNIEPYAEPVSSAAAGVQATSVVAASAVTGSVETQAPKEIAKAPLVDMEPPMAPPATPQLAARPPFVPDLFTPSFGQDRRTYPRMRCFIAVELRCEGWEAPVWGNLANVSAGGCFIETMEPVRTNTKLEVGLWANNGKVWVKGVVIRGVVTENKPTFGVQLKYTNMDASERDTLRFFLKFVEDMTKNYEKQNGYLAHMKR